MIDHLLICVPPTPNGGLHLGHLSGPYLGCDVLARALRQRGKTVLTVAGIDDHQGYVHSKAYRDGLTCAEISRTYGDSIRDTWKKAKFEFDLTHSTFEDADYAQFVSDFFSKMLAAGAIQRKSGKTVYSQDGEMCLFQGYLRGTCPHCNRACDGNMCEDCSLPNSGWDIKDLSLSFPELGQSLQEEEVLFVNPTVDWHNRLGKSAKHMTLRADRSAYLETVSKTAKGQADAAVAHRFPWGIPVPDSAQYGQAVIDVWFEMAAAFLYYPEYAGQKWESVWSSDTKKSIFFGVDNSFYVAAMFPYLYSHLPDITPPDYLFSNYFLYLEGQKFSTSRNHAIWGADFFASEPVDIGRFYLACHRPEDGIENFDTKGYSTFKAEKTKQFSQLSAAILPTGLDRLLNAPSPPMAPSFANDLRDIDVFLSPDSFSVKRAASRLSDMLADWVVSEDTGTYAHKVRAAYLVQALAPIAPELFDLLYVQNSQTIAKQSVKVPV